jgi:hypothetical protein
MKLSGFCKGLLKKESFKMKKLFGILFVVVFMSFLVGSVFAQMAMEKEAQGGDDPMMSSMMGGGDKMCPMCGEMKPMMGMMNMNMIEQMADKLNLTKEQKDKAMAIFIAHHKDMIRKKADLELAQVDMYELMSQENPSMDTIQKQVMNIAGMEGGMKFAQIKVWMDAKALLTDEQKAALKKMMMKGMMKGEKGIMMGEKQTKESKSEKPKKSEKSGMKEMKDMKDMKK